MTEHSISARIEDTESCVTDPSFRPEFKQTHSIRCQVARAEIRSSEMLSMRECDILTLVGRGLSNKRIAQALIIAPETAKSHVKRIFIQLEVKTRAEAVFRAGTQGLLRTGKSWT